MQTWFDFLSHCTTCQMVWLYVCPVFLDSRFQSELDNGTSVTVTTIEGNTGSLKVFNRTMDYMCCEFVFKVFVNIFSCVVWFVNNAHAAPYERLCWSQITLQTHGLLKLPAMSFSSAGPLICVSVSQRNVNWNCISYPLWKACVKHIYMDVFDRFLLTQRQVQRCV